MRQSRAIAVKMIEDLRYHAMEVEVEERNNNLARIYVRLSAGWLSSDYAGILDVF